MPFRFGLQPVLHLRQSLEHQQESRLRAAHQQVGRVRHLIEQMEAHHSDLHRLGRGRLAAGVTAAELRFDLQCETELLRHRRELEQQLVRLQQVRDQQREILRQARLARETLEGVRDRQLRSYEQDAKRREQKNLDEMFLLRREHFRRG
jgi:flagellar export protein FliJ